MREREKKTLEHDTFGHVVMDCPYTIKFTVLLWSMELSNCPSDFFSWENNKVIPFLLRKIKQFFD